MSVDIVRVELAVPLTTILAGFKVTAEMPIALGGTTLRSTVPQKFVFIPLKSVRKIVELAEPPGTRVKESWLAESVKSGSGSDPYAPQVTVGTIDGDRLGAIILIGVTPPTTW